MAMHESNKPSSTSIAHYGQQLGLLRSISETKQLGIIALSVLLWGGLWQFHVIEGFVFVFGCVATMLGLYSIALRFGDSLQVFEQGLKLQSNSRAIAFAYDEITSISAKRTDHYMKHTYIATKAELKFELQDRFTEFRFECDYRRNGAKERLVYLALEKCSEAVQVRLVEKLNAQGEILWTENVYLPKSGLKIVDPSGVTRVIPFAEIEEQKMDDNQLKIWKRNDAMPFLTLSNKAPNFVPASDLFRKITESSGQINRIPELGSMDDFATAAADQVYG